MYHNVKALILPHEKMWKIFYVANNFISKGEELSINYGSSYWLNRI